MAGRYGLTATDIRNYIGLQSNEISDAILEDYILKAEEDAEARIGTAWIPRERIDSLQSNGGTQIKLPYGPIGRLKTVKIDDDSITASSVNVNRGAAILTLTEDSEVRYWNRSVERKNRIHYTYAKMIEGTTQTTTSAAVSASDNVVVSVSSSSGFTADDYVLIKDIDGGEELTQVESVGASSLTMDLSQDHPSGALISKVDIPEKAKELISLMCGWLASVYMIAGTKDFQTSYGLGDLNVVKGEPYPPFDRLLTDLDKRIKTLTEQMKRPQVL